MEVGSGSAQVLDGEELVGGATSEADGRRLRRQRNRLAVVDALLDLYQEGNLRPSSAQIAERAGLSPRSLFRYFDDVDDLCRTAIARQEGRAQPLLRVPAGPDDTLELRIRAVVDQRVRLFEAIAPVATVARMEAPVQPTLAAGLRRSRQHHRTQLAHLLEPELTRMGRPRAGTTLAALDVLCSFESYQLLRHDQGLQVDQVTIVLVSAIEGLVAQNLRLEADPV